MNEHAIIAGALIDAWADRLDSGIPQTYGALRTRKGQCCLGVYSDIAGIEHTMPQHDGEEAPAVYKFDGAHNTVFPTSALMREIGLTESGVPYLGFWEVPDELLSVMPDGDRQLFGSLASLNDDTKLTFPQIATLLRHNKGRLMQWVNDNNA